MLCPCASLCVCVCTCKKAYTPRENFIHEANSNKDFSCVSLCTSFKMCIHDIPTFLFLPERTRRRQIFLCFHNARRDNGIKNIHIHFFRAYALHVCVCVSCHRQSFFALFIRIFHNEFTSNRMHTHTHTNTDDSILIYCEICKPVRTETERHNLEPKYNIILKHR